MSKIECEDDVKREAIHDCASDYDSSCVCDMTHMFETCVCDVSVTHVCDDS